MLINTTKKWIEHFYAVLHPPICKSCQRELPNTTFNTKNGCKWCDLEYNQKNKQSEK